MTQRFRFEAEDGSLASEARRAALALAARRGLDETEAGKVAVVVAEAATNLVKHGGGGELLVAPSLGPTGVEVLALDRGRGMANPAACMRDGYSTAGTAGTGLGAISRLATRFDIHSTPTSGTALVARVGAASVCGAFDVGGVAVPAPGESVCGDAWSTVAMADGLRVLVVDGLGHGAVAGEAAAQAVAAFAATGTRPLEEIMEAVHGALRSTRGAAVGIASIDTRRRVVTFTGVGNVAGVIVGEATARNTVSHGGIMGHGVRRTQLFTYPWPPGGLLVMLSDGIASQWSLDAYPGLRQRDPALIAGVIYRDFVRGRDDATVVVVRERPS